MIRCVVCHNDEQVKSYEITDSVITIGRLPENTISIANMGISRRHVRIERDASRNYVLIDLNSLNGTILNNQKVKKAILANGDKITIGKYSVIIDEIFLDAPSDSSSHETLAPPGIDEPFPELKMPEIPMDAKEKHTGSGPALIETGKHAVYPITKRVMSVGDSEDDDIFVSGFLIGEGHIILERRDDGIYVSCSKKSGKFKLNGKKATSCKLKHKDRLEIGDNIFAFMENG